MKISLFCLFLSGCFTQVLLYTKEHSVDEKGITFVIYLCELTSEICLTQTKHDFLSSACQHSHKSACFLQILLMHGA